MIHYHSVCIWSYQQVLYPYTNWTFLFKYKCHIVCEVTCITFFFNIWHLGLQYYINYYIYLLYLQPTKLTGIYWFHFFLSICMSICLSIWDGHMGCKGHCGTSMTRLWAYLHACGMHLTCMSWHGNKKWMLCSFISTLFCNPHMNYMGFDISIHKVIPGSMSVCLSVCLRQPEGQTIFPGWPFRLQRWLFTCMWDAPHKNLLWLTCIWDAPCKNHLWSSWSSHFIDRRMHMVIPRSTSVRPSVEQILSTRYVFELQPSFKLIYFKPLESNTYNFIIKI